MTPWREAWHLPWELSLLAALGLWSIVLGMVAVVARRLVVLGRTIARYRAAARRAARGEDGCVIVRGRVVAPSPGAAVIVRQVSCPRPVRGRRGKQAPERRGAQSAFALVLDDGERLRVEPDADLVLVTRCEQASSREARSRRSLLEHGDRVHLLAEVTWPTRHEPDYRRQPTAVVGTARSPAAEPMVIGQAHPLELAVAVRRRLWRGLGWGLLAYAIVHAVLFGTFYARALGGVVEQPAVTGKRVVPGRVRQHMVALAEVAGAPVALDAPTGAFERVEVGARLPVLVVPGAPFTAQLGEHPTFHVALVFVAFVLSLVPVSNVVALPYAVRGAHDPPWERLPT